MKKRFNLLFCLVLALLASTVSVKATTGQMYYQLRVKAILADGSPASSYVACRGYYDQSAVTPSSNDYTMAVSSSSWGDYPDLNLYGTANNGEDFVGWYLDQACTQLLCSTLSREIYNTSNAPGIAGITTYATAAEVQTQTIYAKFSVPSMNWTTYGGTPAAGNYYIYALGYNGFVMVDGSTPKGTKDPANATLFTLTSGTTTTLSCVTLGITRYLAQSGTSMISTPDYSVTLEPSGNFYYVKLARTSYNYWEMESSGRCDYENKSESSSYLRWIFIPEATYNDFVAVESLKQSGSIIINSAPTASGSTSVQFNVSEVGSVSSFEATITGGDGNFALGEITRSGTVVTVPVTYTAHNVHSGTSTPISTATVTLTAKNEAATSASGTVSAYVDLQPKFGMTVSTLDWSYVGEELVETYYVSMEVAASQRERLQNKLIKNDAQTTGVAANNATWTATITGTDADQFKFANGTRTVSGHYSAGLLDVIFAPQATGDFTATLHIVTNYTDANSNELTDTHDIILKGKGLDVSFVTFAANGNETASNNENHNFGDIIGTNAQTVTAELNIHSVSNLTKVWSDPAGVFEFDINSVDLTKSNQTLTFRAHRETPVTTATNHTATLTVSGDGTDGPIFGVLTLTYQALPLITPTVTWNWSTVGEYKTVTNPITTNSDATWTLTKTAGDKVTYNAEAKTATTAYLHHEPGVTATFALSMPQTDTYAAFNSTYTATINAVKPADIYINSAENFNTYVEGNSWVTYDAELNSVHILLDNAYFKWSGQTTFAFDFVGIERTNTFKEVYSDNSTRTIYNENMVPGHYEFAVSPDIVKLHLYGSNDFANVHYFEYDTITADYERVVLVNDNGVINSLDLSCTFAKQAVNVTLSPAAQTYFELQSAGKSAGSSLIFDANDGLAPAQAINKVITVAMKAGANAEAAKAASANGDCWVTFGDTYTYNHFEFNLPILLKDAYDVTYKHHAHGSYTVTYEDDGVAHAVSSEDYVKHMTSIAPEHCTVTVSAPTPATGYKFQGWKINDQIVSLKSSITKMFDEAVTIEPVFGIAEGAFKIDATYFDDLTEALSVAGSVADQEPVVTLMKDTVLSVPATYTIPAGVTLLIPHKANYYEKQFAPELVIVTEEKLYAYRTLTLQDGVNFICNGNISVAGKMIATGGGNKSAYVTGGCGVINMVHGGHIELNNGANLYCWGFIKGQDMDQGNNTVGTGTVTANAGAVIWENFCLGDWRGGTASSNIYFESEKMLFPFQSYSIQNIEIPTTYHYGAKLMNSLALHTGYGDFLFDVATIGSEQTLFLLQDEASIVRKWYDPTTDLTCYELNGTAQLGSLIMNMPFIGDFDSGEYNLPVSNSMHIIIANCNMTLAKPLTIQAGAVLEIKNTATVNLEAPIHMFDVDDWGLYIHNFYFRSFNNLTSHKNRGAENSKAGLDDAKVIIDGTLNVKAGKGYIYATTGGANLMGNGGGIINFEGALPTAGTLWQVNVLGESPYITWVENPETAANLCNENGTYTPSDSYTTYYNVNGRWFYENDKDGQEDHTYNFYYLNNGNTGEEVGTAAVYSNDKTGLEARMKWFNVEADACENWWTDAAGRFYNYTMLGEWHQFMETETENVFSCSNNVLYLKGGCDWVENGYIDENCLYTIGGVKKALVNGNFIALESNGYDAAYHATANASQYYICFQGCNWHEATPYTGELKTYTIVEDAKELIYIWFNNDWMNVEREEPFFYTADEQTNVRTYYEYVNGEWVVATPYVSVTDASETRTFYSLNEAFTVASIKKNATITILRDLPNITTSLVFSTANTTCTLDLNGHIVTGSCANLLNINAPGSTFIVTDNSTYKNGELRAMPSANSRQTGYTVTAGTLKLEAGKMYATNAMERDATTNKDVRINGIVIAAGATMNMTGGTVECIDEYNNYGIRIDANSTTKGVMNMSGGRVIVHATKWDSPYGILVNYGRLNLSGDAYIECVAEKSTTSYGVSVQATSYPGDFNMTGGTIYSKATGSPRGVQVNGTATVTGDYNAATPNNTPKARYYATANISGGTITAEAETTTDPYGVLSYGTTNISGGTITAKVLASNKSQAWGVRTLGGTTTLSGSVSVTANAPTKAYALSCSAANGDSNRGWHHDGVLVVNGGTFTANATSTTTAYGLYVSGSTYNINKDNGYSVFNGDYACAGTATVNGGEFYANANTNTAIGIVVDNTVVKNAASATPVCTINGGKFKMTGTGALNGANAASSADNFHINGGYYSHDGNLATYAAAPKHVSELPNTDALYPDYKYEVANAYLVNFMNGETELQSSYQKENTTATYNGAEPTKASTELNSYIFDGWSATDGGDVISLASVTADATYYAHFNETTLKYTVKFDAKTNGGNEVDQIIYVDPNAAIGDLPSATKTGHTLTGWFTTSTAGTQITASTQITANVTYFAQFAPNQHTLTWDANGGTIAGTYTNGTVNYGTTITAPTNANVTRAGYTFAGWDATPATKMPDNDLTYTAQWNPATNTAYTVQHKQQNLANLSEYTVYETENLTGTTGAYITPKPKAYAGYISPTEKTVQILADGSLVVEYLYDLITYTITLDANGGTCATTSLSVKHGATPSLPVATRDETPCRGWFTKAIGGDQITSETAILYNIGTLYAQYADLNVTAPLTVSDTREVDDVRITTKGSLTITGSITTHNLILESTTSESGQLVGVPNLTVTGKAYFDVLFNGETGTANRTWYAIAVPWEVDAVNGIFWKEGNRHLILGRDFDLVWYDGAERATNGDSYACWKYLEDESDKMMHPGKMYMMYFGSQFKTVRFEKNAGKPIIYTSDADAVTTVATHAAQTGDPTDADWNGIANPSVCHAYLNAGTTYGQVLNNGSLDNYQHNEGSPVYSTVALSSYKFVVGKPVYVQATSNQSITVTPAISGAFLAPKRAKKSNTPEGIDAVYALHIAAEGKANADNLFVQVTEDAKENKYVIGQDLAKGGVATSSPQLWVNRYDSKLSVNTQTLIGNVAEYPLSIYAPQDGDYVINTDNADDEYALYLTQDGQVIWNLGYAPYTITMEKGVSTAYGLRIMKKSPEVTTTIDEAIIDAHGETRKVLINGQVFIIRDGNVYSIFGQKAQ